MPEDLVNDPRLNWPHRYFHYACQCEGHHVGFSCEECKYGWTGYDCTIRKQPVVRKNALALSEEEKVKFRRALNVMKQTVSPYVAIQKGFGTDDNISDRFVNVSVYDFFTFEHFFAVRSPIINDQLQCLHSNAYFNDTALFLDFAHAGPGFLTWHRRFLMDFERELQEASGDSQLALPYWDWSDHNITCSVCTNDLVGAMNLSDPSGLLETSSDFHHWKMPCQPPKHVADSCAIQDCDLDIPPAPIWRLPLNKNRDLPTLNHIKFALNAKSYDTEPYGATASKDSFRNSLEGFVSVDGTMSATNTLRMHNQVGFDRSTMATHTFPHNFQRPMHKT